MTDEEMAEEYRKSLKQRLIDEDNFERLEMFDENVEEAFLAGLKAGRPQWHDLRKDKKDLPNGYKVVLNQVGMATQYDPNRGFLGFGGAGIIAWCELPIFDKE